MDLSIVYVIAWCMLLEKRTRLEEEFCRVHAQKEFQLMVKRDYRAINIMLARVESNFLTFEVLLKSLPT